MWRRRGAPSTVPTTQSATTVVNQSGGSIALNDGTTVTIPASLVKDGTVVTVTSTAQPTSAPTQEVQALSPTVVIDMPPNSVLASAPAGSEITIEIPVTGNITQSLMTGLSTVSTQASVVSAAKNIVQLVLQDPAGQIGTAKQITTYYAPLILKSPGKIAVSIGIAKLCKTAVGGLVCTVAKVTVGAKNSVQCTQQNTSLFQVDFLNDKPVFNSNISRNGKPPLILVHGWQEIGIMGMFCDKPYASTWQKFFSEYALDPAILDKFQVFSLAYSSSNPVQGSLGVGNEFAQIIKTQFGQDAVYVVAHSMGGVVARTALVNYGANIKGLVTLATPHHGTPAASQEGVALFGSTPLYPIFDYVIGGEGIRDLAWDNFDGFQPPFNDRRGNLGNPFLEKLNADDIYQGRYVVFAAVDNEPTIGSILKSMGYDNDLVVPDKSALLYASNSVPDSRIKLQKRFNGLLHLNLVGNGITDSVGVLSETRLALLDFLNDTPPTVPVSLSATASSTTQINLSWAAATDNVAVAGYKIYKGGVLIASPTTLAYSDTGLTPSTQYCYTVSAFDAAGNESAQSSQQCVTTQAIPVAPSAPSGINAAAGDGQAIISWNAVAGVTYNLYMASVSGVTKANYTTLADGMQHVGVTSPYTHSGLTNSKPYYFVVTAVNANGESIESAEVSITPTIVACSGLGTVMGAWTRYGTATYDVASSTFTVGDTLFRDLGDIDGDCNPSSVWGGDSLGQDNDVLLYNTPTTGDIDFSWQGCVGSTDVSYQFVGLTELNPLFTGLPNSIQAPWVNNHVEFGSRWESPLLQVIIDGVMSPIPNINPSTNGYCGSFRVARVGTNWQAYYNGTLVGSGPATSVAVVPRAFSVNAPHFITPTIQ